MNEQYDKNNNLIYTENPDGSWRKQIFNKNKDVIYRENHTGSWSKYECDSNTGFRTYQIDNDGDWFEDKWYNYR